MDILVDPANVDSGESGVNVESVSDTFAIDISQFADSAQSGAGQVMILAENFLDKSVSSNFGKFSL
jgi:hypothetical protein